MPEAVIVSAARTPIGRAFKGSLKDVRPDDLAAQVVEAALAKVPGTPFGANAHTDYADRKNGRADPYGLEQ